MNYAADFRRIARDALRGKWLLAVLTGFVASLIGAGNAFGRGGGSGGGSDSSDGILHNFQSTELWIQLRPLIVAATVILIVWVIALIVISGAGKLGYATFNLKLVDGRDAAFSDLFSQFGRLGEGFCMNFFTALFTFLWSLLFVIPGIIKSFSYAMTPYILAENPGLTALDAITESKRLMKGNKWRLFCLSFSFIGWALLCVLPVFIALIPIYGRIAITGNVWTLLWLIPSCIPTFIGTLFLRPYQEAAYAAFYRDISGTAAAAAPTGENGFDEWN